MIYNNVISFWNKKYPKIKNDEIADRVNVVSVTDLYHHCYIWAMWVGTVKCEKKFHGFKNIPFKWKCDAK